jgi:hypothetical protein
MKTIQVPVNIYSYSELSDTISKLNQQIKFYKSLLNSRETELKEVHQYLWDCNELYYKDMANVSARFIHSLTKEHIDIFFHCYIPLQHIASDDYNGELAAYRDVAIRWKYLENEAYNNLCKEHPELLDAKFWILSSANILNEDEFMSEEDINELYLGSPEDYI